MKFLVVVFTTTLDYQINVQYGSLYRLSSGTVAVLFPSGFSINKILGFGAQIEAQGMDEPYKMLSHTDRITFEWINPVSYTATKGCKIHTFVFGV